MKSWFLIVLVIAAWGCDDASPAEETATSASEASAISATSGEAVETPTEDAPSNDSDSLGDQIVVASGPITELVYALGHGDRIAAVDSSSIYPAEATERPQIGFFRKLAAEPILAVDPSAVLVSESAGPAPTLEQLEESGVTVHVFEEADSFESAAPAFRRVAEALGTPDRAEPLVKKLAADLESVDSAAANFTGKRALFIYARGPNVLMVAGTDTAADVMLERAGLTNAAADMTGFKPMTPEAVIATKPDVLVMTEKGAKSVGGWKGIAALPGVEQTPAASGERLATVDDLAFLSFGPRTGVALLSLQKQLDELF